MQEVKVYYFREINTKKSFKNKQSQNQGLGQYPSESK